MSLRSQWLFVVVPAFIAGCDHSETTFPTPLNTPGGLTLNWIAPTEYQDGSFLPWSELDEFRIYADQKLVGNVAAHLTSYHLALPAGAWEISMSSVARGVESLPSDPVLIEVPES